MAGIREKNQNIMICFTGKVEDKGEGWGFGCAACGAVPQYHTWTMVPAQSKLLSLIAHSKWCCWRPRRDVSWTTALAVGGLNGVWNKAAQRGVVMEGLHQHQHPNCILERAGKWSGVVRSPASSWQRWKHRLAETGNGKEVCEHSRGKRLCSLAMGKLRETTWLDKTVS